MECCGCLQTNKSKGQKNKKDKGKHPIKKGGQSRNIADLHGDPFQRQHQSMSGVDSKSSPMLPKRQTLQRMNSKKTTDPNRHTQLTYLSMQNQLHISKDEQLFQVSSPITNSNANIGPQNTDKLFNGTIFSKNQTERNNQVKDELSSNMSHYQQPTIYACKQFKFYCSNCLKPFQKILLHDINLNKERYITLASVQELFNIPDNQSCNCPFCNDTIQLILSTSLIVGNYDQMEQYDLINNSDNLHLIESEYDTNLAQNRVQIQQEQHHATLEVNMSENNVKIIENQDNDLQSNKTSQNAQQKNVTFKVSHPVVIRHKLQMLKDPKKYAQMIIIGELKSMQQKSTLVGANTTTKATNIDTEDLVSSTHQDSNLVKYVTPEMHHKVDQAQCYKFNKDIMRAVINKKMRKNKSYLELKVLPSLQLEKKPRKVKPDGFELL